MKTACGVVALAAMLMALACTPSAEFDDRSDLSLICISLDTLRADPLSLHGYDRDTTPSPDALARRGAYVQWAVTPQTSTLPTHMTQFTGHHPVVHGVMHAKKNPGIRRRAKPSQRSNRTSASSSSCRPMRSTIQMLRRPAIANACHAKPIDYLAGA